MAEDDSSQEKSQEPTQKKLDDARRKADIPRSKELNTLVVITLAMAGVSMLGPLGAYDMRELASGLWQLDRREIYGDSALVFSIVQALIDMLWLLAPFLLVMLVAALVGPLSMGGWAFSVEALKPDLKKLDPIKGLKKVFGPQGLVELFKAVMKFVCLGGAAFWLLSALADDFVALGVMPLAVALPKAFVLAGKVLWPLLLVLALVALVDVPWQRFQHAKKLRMTFQQIKEEGKETNGNPEVKQKVRQLQHTAANRRMLLDVPEANVIIVNPAHYAVALRYDDTNPAPEVLAKGVDHMAARIREIAMVHHIPVFEAPPLARALYRHAEIGQEIPPELYLAVAQVLAYIYQVQKARFGQRIAPPDDLPIPPEMGDPYS